MIKLAILVLALALTAVAATILALRIRFEAVFPWFLVVGTGFGILFSAAQPSLIFDHNQYLIDLWSTFDTAQKSMQGTASSLDYFNPIGPLYDWVFRAATLLHGTTATTVPFASALLAVIVFLAGGLQLQNRVSFTTLGIVLLVAVSVVLSPREMDAALLETKISWLAPYNRWAWGLLVPLTLSLCVPAPFGAAGRVLAGLSITALILLKVTYGAAATGLLILCFFLRVRTVWDTFIILLSALLGLVLLQGLTAQILPYFSDLQQVAGFGSAGLRLTKLIAQSPPVFFWIALGVTLLYLFRVMRHTVDPEAPAKFWQPALLICIVAFMGNTILMQNHSFGHQALFLTLPLIALEWVWGREASDHKLRTAAHLLVLALCVPVPAFDMGHVFGQTALHFQEKTNPSRAILPAGDIVFRDRRLLSPSCTERICQEYRLMSQGTEALRHLGADAPDALAVMNLGFANPFPFLLNAASPVRAPIWLDNERSFSSSHHLSGEILFEGIGYVVYAEAAYSASSLFAIYEEYLKDTFTIVVETDDFVIYHRN